MKLPNGAWVVVCDAGKYLLLKNIGGETHLDLRVVAHDERTIAKAGELSSDRPGTFPAYGERRGGSEPTDWHDLEEERFAGALTETLNKMAEAGRFKHLLIIADKHSLGLIRDAVSKRLANCVIKDIGADYAHRTLEDIEAFITGAAE